MARQDGVIFDFEHLLPFLYCLTDHENHHPNEQIYNSFTITSGNSKWRQSMGTCYVKCLTWTQAVKFKWRPKTSNIHYNWAKWLQIFPDEIRDVMCQSFPDATAGSRDDEFDKKSKWKVTWEHTQATNTSGIQCLLKSRTSSLLFAMMTVTNVLWV